MVQVRIPPLSPLAIDILLAGNVLDELDADVVILFEIHLLSAPFLPCCGVL
jgi:hypothetical protein